jgi:para-nitrobenzyl esterase
MIAHRLFLTAAIVALTSPVAATAQARDTVVATDRGEVRGAIADGVASWKGIPFAAAPVGALRWRAPQPAAAWKGVKDTTAYSHDCMQVPFPSDAAPLGTQPAEDCLYANVWKPAAASASAKLPVIVWIYGGGFDLFRCQLGQAGRGVRQLQLPGRTVRHVRTAAAYPAECR